MSAIRRQYKLDPIPTQIEDATELKIFVNMRHNSSTTRFRACLDIANPAPHCTRTPYEGTEADTLIETLRGLFSLGVKAAKKVS
jgi:hypothetical protein